MTSNNKRITQLYLLFEGLNDYHQVATKTKYEQVVKYHLISKTTTRWPSIEVTGWEPQLILLYSTM